MISCTVQQLLVLGTLVFLRSSLYRYIAHGRIINFFISEDNCDDDAESHSIRVGWWMVGFGFGFGFGFGVRYGGFGFGFGVCHL